MKTKAFAAVLFAGGILVGAATIVVRIKAKDQPVTTEVKR